MRTWYYGILLLFVVALTGCTTPINPDGEPKIVLNTPQNVFIDGDILRWDEVEEADGYFVSYRTTKGSIAVSVTTNEFDLSTSISNYLQEIKVRATHYHHFNSNYSASLVYSKPLDAPTIIESTDDHIITWNPVRNAVGYKIIFMLEDVVIRESLVLETTYNGLQLNKEGVYQVHIQTLGEVSSIHSEYSIALEMPIRRDQVKLSAPSNIRIVDNVLRWDIVQEANEYCVRISYSGKRDLYFTEVNLFDLSFLPKNTYQISIQANGEDDIQPSTFSLTKAFIVSLCPPTDLTITNDTLQWEHEVDATSYFIIINDELEFETESNTFGLESLEYGEYEIKIFSRNKPLSSNRPSIIHHTVLLKTPINVSVSENQLQWDIVPGANAYRIVFDNLLFAQQSFTYNSNIVQLSQFGLVEGTYTVRIQAILDILQNSSIDSLLSEPVVITIENQE